MQFLFSSFNHSFNSTAVGRIISVRNIKKVGLQQELICVNTKEKHNELAVYYSTCFTAKFNFL